MMPVVKKFPAFCLTLVFLAGGALAQTVSESVTHGAGARMTQEDADRECDSWPDIPVNIAPRFDEPVYDYSVDIGSLQALASDATRTVHGGHRGLALGLTRYEPVLAFRVPIKGVQMSNGLSCAHVEKVDVDIGYRNVTVYIPHEVAQGSCGFDQVMAHEQKHIAVNRAILAEYQPLIEQRLKDFLRENGVFKEENPDYAENLLKQHLHDILTDMSQQMFTENRQRQQEVDNPQEYANVSASCNGQLRYVAMHYTRGE